MNEWELHIPLTDLDETESFNLDLIAQEEGLERTDYTVYRTSGGLAITVLDNGVEHDLTNGLDLP